MKKARKLLEKLDLRNIETSTKVGEYHIKGEVVIDLSNEYIGYDEDNYYETFYELIDEVKEKAANTLAEYLHTATRLLNVESVDVEFEYRGGDPVTMEEAEEMVKEMKFDVSATFFFYEFDTSEIDKIFRKELEGFWK